jgi:predicted transcriptional regulator
LISEIGIVRSLLSNEKAKIIHHIKEKNPGSIYILAKHLGRDFKSVRKDVSVLQHFGIITLIKQEKGRRKGLKPVLNMDSLQINIAF